MEKIGKYGLETQDEGKKPENYCINYRAFLHEFSLLDSVLTR